MVQTRKDAQARRDGKQHESLTVTDNRTGRSYEIVITDGTVRAKDFRQLKAYEGDFGLMVYDPGFANTASCRSSITHIDGERGILEYRGYPIEELAEKSSFLETAYLLLYGELPGKPQLDQWVHDITFHTYLHENVKKFMEGFQYDAHPMGMLLGTVAALSTFYTDAKNVSDPRSRDIQTHRLIAKMPTIAAFGYKKSIGHPIMYPRNDLSYVANFMYMMFAVPSEPYEPDPVVVDTMNKLFILHADHEQNCSTTTMRTVGSSDTDPYSAAAGAVAALYGSTRELPTDRIAFAEQFCSWSACRMNKTSIAFSSTGFG